MNTTTSLNHSRGMRLGKLHADELIKLSGDDFRVEFHGWKDLIQINHAHVIMLCEQHLITEDDATTLLRCLYQVEKDGAENVVPLDLKIGDMITCLEAYVINETGIDCGGKINMGRSRNDTLATLSKMDIKSVGLKIYEALIALEETFLKLAEEHLETVLPGYTHHSKHAQPITLGYFYLGNCDVFLRNMLRFENFWPRLNTCPMGAAALSTTGFALNRSRMAELLGFDAIHEHAYDAISAKDFVLEYLFILSSIASDLGRIAENLLLWSTYEFGMIELADEYTSFSSIMPQKKNAVALECIRAINPIITGKLTDAFGILKAMPWSNGRETTILNKDHIDTGEQVKDMVVLLVGLLKSMKINADRMNQLTMEGFSTTTELADILVREYDFSFRAAHEIVGMATRKAIDAGRDATALDSHMVEKCIEVCTGQKIHLDPQQVRSALDPLNNIMVRNLPGGPAPEEVRRMIGDRRREMQSRCSFFSQKNRQIEERCTELSRMVQAVIEKD